MSKQSLCYGLDQVVW